MRGLCESVYNNIDFDMQYLRPLRVTEGDTSFFLLYSLCLQDHSRRELSKLRCFDRANARINRY